jgi:hypothetical protein
MLRSILSAIALAGVLAAVQPAFACPLATPAPEHVQAAATVTERPTLRASARSPSSDATARVSAAHDGDIPVGFGWG